MNIFSFKLFSKLYYFFLLLVVVIFVGTMGYMLIEEWSSIDSFYMTVITISTVGFREVRELSNNGKIFTAGLIISSFGTFGYAITSITSYLVGGEYKKFIKEHKVMKQLANYRNHVIICGFGRVGRQVAEDLRVTNTPFVIIENDQNTIDDNDGINDFIFIKGDATQEEILSKGNVSKAKAVITCLPKDADNLYVVLSTREMSSRILIVSRGSTQGATTKLKFAGANNVILPDTIGGSHMASLISNPDVMEFLDIVRVQASGGININSVAFSELPQELQNMTIGQLEAKELTGVTIIGFKTPEGEYIINPASNITVVPHSKLFVLGNEDQISKMKHLFGLNH
ncbi:MAG: voltage-gated potassium channel [Psychromonas sp.]|jgi:voltage-gated potassium channel